MSKIVVPEALKSIAYERNFFMYLMPMKIPVGLDSIKWAKNTDKVAVSTMWEVIEKLEYLERKPEILEMANQERAERAAKYEIDYTPIEGFRIGYVPRSDSAGVVVDLDDCVDDDGNVVLDDPALQIAFDVYADGGGYWETSPSGRGVRVVMPRVALEDELRSDRREACGVGFQAAQEKAKGFTLTLSGEGEWKRGDALVDEVVRVRDAGLTERRTGEKGVEGDVSDVALQFVDVTIEDFERMLEILPNGGPEKSERGWFTGMTKAIRETFEPRGLGEEAWELWDHWLSLDPPGRYDPEWNRRVWDEPLKEGVANRKSLASIIKEANSLGFVGSWRRDGESEFDMELDDDEGDAGDAGDAGKEVKEESEDPYDFLKRLDMETVGPKGAKVRRPVYNYINCVRIVRHMPKLKGLVGRDILCGGLLRLRRWKGGELDVPVEWTDLDMHQLLQTVQGMKKGGHSVFGHFGVEGLKSGIEGAAVPVQPIKRMLDRLEEWDGVERIDGWLERYFGVDEPLGRVYSRKFMIGLMARGRAERGRTVKMDTVLVLRGEQGRNKSSFFQSLAEGFFTDHVGEIRKKESLENIAGRWVVELSEGDVVSKADRRFLNGFLTRVEDRFRPSYARNVETFPRACVFVMPTNDQEVLMDPTGSRRFWPVTVNQKADLKMLARERRQMLAEALVALEKGEQWWLTDEEEQMRIEGSSAYEMELSVEGPLERMLKEVPRGQIISMSDILGGLGLPEIGANAAITAEIRVVLRKWGWEKARNKAKRGFRRGVTGDTLPEMTPAAKSKLDDGEVVALCEFSSEAKNG